MEWTLSQGNMHALGGDIHKKQLADEETGTQRRHAHVEEDPILGNAPKKYASRYYQLKVGHGAVGTFLIRIRVMETPECWWCKEVLQSVEYLFTKCRRWRKEWRKVVRELEKRGIPWQIQGERNWVAGLLGNEKAVAPLLKFLETTDVGGREGARERELEWERKNDQADEDLLD